jgi:RNA 3'-terminal phosphate cyclase
MGLLPESIILVREVSDHVKTNIYVVEKFLKVQFEIENDKIKVKGL